MAESERDGGRVVLAIDTGSLTAPTLEAAAALALGLGSGLSALFVEDERLLRVAALPFTHAVGFASAQLQRIGLEEMERAFRIQAEHLRRIVEETAERLALAWTLEVTRGEILAVSLARLAPRDLLVVGKGRPGRLALGGAAGRPERFRALVSRPVIVFFDESEAALRGLEAGSAIARVIATGLTIAHPTPGTTTLEARRARAARWLAERGVAARHLMVPSGDIPALAAAIRAQGAGTLVWPNPPDSDALPALAALIELVSCPVVVLPWP
jgi:hypothetical protein